MPSAGFASSGMPAKGGHLETLSEVAIVFSDSDDVHELLSAVNEDRQRRDAAAASLPGPAAANRRRPHGRHLRLFRA